jgi:hypothetical protein
MARGGCAEITEPPLGGGRAHGGIRATRPERPEDKFTHEREAPMAASGGARL